MTLAIISLAPSYPFKAQKAIRARWPDVDLDSIPIVTFYGYSWDGRLFDIPRHIPWQDLPVRRPVARLKSNFIGYRTGIRGAASNNNTIDDLRPILMQAHEILLLCDKDSEAIGAAKDCVHDVFGTIPRGRIVFPMDLFGIRDHSVDRVKIVAEAGWFENAAAEIISSSAISDYFDFNYVLNATPILGLAARNAGLRGSSPSAFGLQLLYWLRENGEGAEAFHLRNVVMRNWTGLGKYADGKGMGSMRSRQTIVERLVQGGYLEDDWACDRVEMTDQARQFLSILHKDCRDPDLPFRIRKWGALPAEEGHRKVDGYIKAFFGKQARTTDRSGMTRAAAAV